MCAVLVGLPAMVVVGVAEWPSWLLVVITSAAPRPVCSCGAWPHRHGVVEVDHVDLPVFGRPARLRWRKQRWRCVACRRVWRDNDPQVASARCRLTTRAAQWATFEVGHGRPVADVAKTLGCDWHTVMDAVMLYGSVLVADPHRIDTVGALGLDETLFARHGQFRTQCWSTQIVDVARGQLLDVVEGRNAAGPCRWLAGRPRAWRDAIRWATLDLSNSYKTVFDTMLPDATQVADPFHVVRVANQAVDECRRRVQNETLGHRGRRDDPLYRVRRRLVMAKDRLSEDGHERLIGLLRAGDPRQEVWFAWNAKEVVRQVYDHTDEPLAAEWVDQIIVDFADREMPPEVRRLGRTIRRWRDQIIAWHRAHVNNGPTEAVNNLVKRVKRVAFGFRRFEHYRIRSLLYAGRPNWNLLTTLTPP